MARRLTLLQLLDQLSPTVRDAFIESILNVRGDTQLAALESAIRNGDVDGALRVLALGPEYFAPLDRAMRSAYEAGGDLAMASLMADASRQGAQVTGRFSERNLRAERYLEQRAAALVVEITESIRDAARDTITAAARAQTSPRTTALDLIGRINRATGRREGGIIGLTQQQAGWARAAFAELTSGDPTLMRSYLSRSGTTRDRRFDRMVATAIREGRAVPRADATRITRAYRNGLLRSRGETIARTELLGSLHAAQDEGIQQMIDRGDIGANAVKRDWDSAEDSATRDSHRAMDGQQRGANEPFTTGAGFQMLYPGDSSLGAPGSEIINCRCVVRLDVDFLSALE